MAQNNTFPLEIQSLNKEDAQQRENNFLSHIPPYVRVGPKGYMLPHSYSEGAADIYNMPIKPGDVFVASFPRSGTTLTQEMVWLLSNELDYEKAKLNPLILRYVFLEYSLRFSSEFKSRVYENNNADFEKTKFAKALFQPAPEVLSNSPSPRFVKTHLPLSLLPPNLLDTAKVVYVARDPRDVAVSFFHLSRLMHNLGFDGEFKTFWKLFINNLLEWTPYFEHVKEAWRLRQHPNMFFIFYEDISKDMSGTIRRLSSFLGKQYNDDQIAGLADHLSIENFKNYKSVDMSYYQSVIGMTVLNAQPFIRKGKTSAWQDYFDTEMTEQAEKWIMDNLSDTDLRFPLMKA